MVSCKVKTLPIPDIWRDKGTPEPSKEDRFTIVSSTSEEGAVKNFEIIGIDTVNKEFFLLVGSNYRCFTISKFHCAYYGVKTEHINKPFIPVTEAFFV